MLLSLSCRYHNKAGVSFSGW